MIYSLIRNITVFNQLIYCILYSRRKLLTENILCIGATDRDAATEILLFAHNKAVAEEIKIGIEWVKAMQDLLREEDDKILDSDSCSAVQCSNDILSC